MTARTNQKQIYQEACVNAWMTLYDHRSEAERRIMVRQATFNVGGRLSLQGLKDWFAMIQDAQKREGLPVSAVPDMEPEKVAP